MKPDNVTTRARDYFKPADAQPLTAVQAAEKFGCSLDYMKGVLAVLRYEGFVRFERKAGRTAERALYHPAAAGQGGAA